MFWKSLRSKALPEHEPFKLPLSYGTFLLGRLPWKGLERALRGYHSELPQDLWPGVTVLGSLELFSNPEVVWVVGETPISRQRYSEMPGLKAHVFLPELSLALPVKDRIDRARPVLQEVYRNAFITSVTSYQLDRADLVAVLVKQRDTLGDSWSDVWPQLEQLKFLPGPSGEFYSPEELRRHPGQIFLVDGSVPEETVRRGRSLGVVCLELSARLPDLLRHYGIPWEPKLKKLKILAEKAGPIVAQSTRDSAVQLFFQRATYRDEKLTLTAGRPGGTFVIDYREKTVRGPRSREGGAAELPFAEITFAGIDEECHQMESRYLTKYFLHIATKRLALTYQVHFSDSFGVYEGMGEDSRRDEWAKRVLHVIPGTLTTNIRMACPQYVTSEPLDQLFTDVPPGRQP